MNDDNDERQARVQEAYETALDEFLPGSGSHRDLQGAFGEADLFTPEMVALLKLLDDAEPLWNAAMEAFPDRAYFAPDEAEFGGFYIAIGENPDSPDAIVRTHAELGSAFLKLKADDYAKRAKDASNNLFQVGPLPPPQPKRHR